MVNSDTGTSEIGEDTPVINAKVNNKISLQQETKLCYKLILMELQQMFRNLIGVPWPAQ